MMEKEQKRHITYLRISEYLRSYLCVKYGGEPILLPESHPCMGIMDKFLVRTPDLIPIYRDSYCEALVDEKMHSMVDSDMDYLPTEDEQKEFTAIVLPHIVHKYSIPVETDGFWTLRRHGVCAFRSLVKDEFWTDCFAFINECTTRAHARGESVTREDAMSDFMTIYNIPMEMFETLIRYHTRERTRMNRQIESRRQTLQSWSRNKMIYT